MTDWSVSLGVTPTPKHSSAWGRVTSSKAAPSAGGDRAGAQPGAGTSGVTRPQGQRSWWHPVSHTGLRGQAEVTGDNARN